MQGKPGSGWTLCFKRLAGERFKAMKCKKEQRTNNPEAFKVIESLEFLAALVLGNQSGLLIYVYVYAVSR